MRAAYDEWCRANGVRAPLGPKAFGQRLRALGVTGGDDASKHAVAGGASSGKAPGFSGGKDRHWRGVRLAE